MRSEQGPQAWVPCAHFIHFFPSPAASRAVAACPLFCCFPKHFGHWTACSLAPGLWETEKAPFSYFSHPPQGLGSGKVGAQDRDLLSSLLCASYLGTLLVLCHTYPICCHCETPLHQTRVNLNLQHSALHVAEMKARPGGGRGTVPSRWRVLAAESLHLVAPPSWA